MAQVTVEEVPEPDVGAAILIVDDDAAKRLAIRAVLEPLGHTLVDADSGDAALHAVMHKRFAMILMDVQMPAMDGYETARLIRMRSECEDTPIIFVTAHTSEEAQIAVAYASGAIDFIFAPIFPDILRAKVTIFVELFLKSRALERSLSDVTTLSKRSLDNEVQIRSVLDHVADGIVTISDEGVIESFNRAATELLGYDEEEAVGRPFSLMVASSHAGDDADDESMTREILARRRRGTRLDEPMGRRQDGSTFSMELDVTDVQLGARKVHIACVRDVSERQIYTDALKYNALHDDLTSLPNRVLFEDRATHAVARAVRADEPLALLLLDLDGFKQVNDDYGHQCGDNLLEQVGKRLTMCLRDADTVARLGGDEFAILPLGGTDLAGAATVAWKIQQALAPAFEVEGHSIEVEVSIGMVLAPEHGDNIDDLLRRADLAMYGAKRGGGGYALFAAEQEEAPARRLALLDDLQHCIERDELVLHYQPKIDLATRETIGVEALIRWNHPSGDLLMPGDFIPEVEGSELMISLTEWVIEEALSQLRAWRDDGYDLTMAVNLGARCLMPGTGLFEKVEEMTAAWDIPADRLTFELTESALIDTAGADLLERLENMDERLSIDDFGTGYSSLVYLQRLPVVEIKADKSFVTTLSSVKEDAVIVRSIIDLAHNLSVQVVAEGVEDEKTMELLLEFGCDAAQGYYFSRPIPGGDLAAWFDTSPFGLARRPLAAAPVPQPAGA
jgi:diguanylate cyclase (GGDEF)-like protein/PAS domain S-box-containing protein